MKAHLPALNNHPPQIRQIAFDCISALALVHSTIEKKTRHPSHGPLSLRLTSRSRPEARAGQHGGRSCRCGRERRLARYGQGSVRWGYRRCRAGAHRSVVHLSRQLARRAVGIGCACSVSLGTWALLCQKLRVLCDDTARKQAPCNAKPLRHATTLQNSVSFQCLASHSPLW